MVIYTQNPTAYGGDQLPMKTFKTTGACIPSKNYMVDLSSRLKAIKAMVDAGDYFTINRARQYGKITTLTALELYLQTEYSVLSLDFQGISTAAFKTEGEFVQALCRVIIDAHDMLGADIPDQYLSGLARRTYRTRKKAR